MNIAHPLLIKFAIIIPAFLIALTIHEFAHAWAAYMLGDDTARDYGRLTLNPLSHIDPLGFLCVLFFGIGWARPVPMNINNFKHRKFYAVLAGLAGPAANFLLALFFLYGIKRVAPFYPTMQASYALTFFNLCAQLNIMLGTFNLLPIPPLDGSHIIAALIPRQWEVAYYRFTRYALFIVLFLLLIPPVQHFLMNLFFIIEGSLKNFVGI